jgi:polyhydroxybutyrate depolymerase
MTDRGRHSTTATLARTAAFVAAAALVAGCSADRIVTSATGYADTADPERQEVTVGTTTRSFLLHVPSTVTDSSAPVSLVIMLHGSGGNAADLRAVTGMNVNANAGGFIVAYAEGSHGNFSVYPSDWNAGTCCGAAAREHIDDLGFLRQIISTVSAEFPIDQRRIYIAGFSDGGRMAYHAACQLAPMIAAIAVVSGSLVDDDCVPADPVAVLAVHGTADNEVLYDEPSATDPTLAVPPQAATLPSAVQFWLAANGCAAGTSVSDQISAHVTQDTFSGCTGADVTAYVIEGGVHGWPGQPDTDASSPMAELNTTDVVARFFAAHPRK